MIDNAATDDRVLEVDNLAIEYKIGTDWVTAVQDINFTIGRGETFGLVGESGCGKTTVAMAIMHHLARNGRVSAGSIRLGGRDLVDLSSRELRKVRVNQVSMVYQNPGTALNPSVRVGRQVGEVYELMGVPRRQVPDKVVDILRKVQIAEPESVARRYPHQLSGGMLQRVVIAMAIASEPELLVLDEPTTGLDATVEAEVLDLVRGLRDDVGMSVLFISHSLSVIRQMCDRVAVLYAGRLVAEGPAEEIFAEPRHPYTKGLLSSLPSETGGRGEGKLDTIPGFLPPLGAEIVGCIYADRCPIAEDICRDQEPDLKQLAGDRTSRCHFPERTVTMPRSEPLEPTKRGETGDRLVEISGASKTFVQDGRPVYALDNIDLTIHVGETVALVGESGSGKSTLAKLLLGIHAPDDGAVITLNGKELEADVQRRGHDDVRSVQMVFQNPDSALNRRHSVKRIIGRAAQVLGGTSKREANARTQNLLDEVRMGTQHLNAKPRHLSGGLKQRVAIARAFAGSPRLVVCDEPTSALDVSVQAAIINLLADLQAEEGVAYLFISHDLTVVRYLADRVAVMYLGRLMEVGAVERIFAGPHHPYTEALLSAAPESEAGTRIRLEGEIPAASSPPSGCVFHTRCPRKIGPICETEEPQLTEEEPGYKIRCHIPVAQLGTPLTITPADRP